jgi:hypothetical protein
MKKGSKWKHSIKTGAYNSWKGMRNRCLYPTNASWNRYGGRGITICREWVDDFDKFFEDMGDRPENTTLDRINSDGNYCKDNCRWATSRVQNNNKNGLTQIEHDGETMTIGEWCNHLDLTEREASRAYKRYSFYDCRSFEELFYDGSLLEKRTSERVNKCLICGRNKSIKWRKHGKLCNTCYHRALRWSKREVKDIEKFHEWDAIVWSQDNAV